MNFCLLFSSINWLWFAAAVVVAFAIGALWYSALADLQSVRH
jgi:hypothetical protein